MNIIKYCFNEIDEMHQWAVEWNKIQEKLVRGKDKHGYFDKVEKMQNSEDESRMKEANEWIRKHHFRGYTNDYIEHGDAAGYMYEEETENK